MRCSSQGLLLCVLSLAAITACNQYKPSSYRNAVGSAPASATGTGSGSGDTVVAGPPTDLSMTVANTKLTALGGTLTAKISFAGQTTSQDFSPTGTQSKLSGLKLPQSTGLLTVEIYQGDALRFIAKKANTTLGSSANNIVVDDCLILRSPWVGTTNEGSCEWTITE